MGNPRTDICYHHRSPPPSQALFVMRPARYPYPRAHAECPRSRPRAQLLFPKFIFCILSYWELIKSYRPSLFPDCKLPKHHVRRPSPSGNFILAWCPIKMSRCAVRASTRWRRDNRRGQNTGCLSDFPRLPFTRGLVTCQMTITQWDES
jgi:hypothetical protein